MLKQLNEKSSLSPIRNWELIGTPNNRVLIPKTIDNTTVCYNCSNVICIENVIWMKNRVSKNTTICIPYCSDICLCADEL